MIILIALMGGLVAASGCGSGGGSGSGKEPEPRSSNISRFSSDLELKTFFVNQYAASLTPNSLRTYLANVDSTNGASSGRQEEHSETNLQETGVDESDWIKTDGGNLYIAAGKGVRVVSAVPAENMREIKTIPVDGEVDSIYLHEGKLVALYRPSDFQGRPWRSDSARLGVGMPFWIPVREKIGIFIIDVSNPASPVILKNIQVDGSLISSRLTGGKLHVVLQFLPDLPPITIWYDGTEAARTAAVVSNTAKLTALSVNDFMPSCRVYDGAGVVVREGRAIRTEDFFCPNPPSGGTMVSIVTVDMRNPTGDFASTAFIADAHTIYASTEALYLTSTLYHYASEERQRESAAVIENPTFETRIHKLSLRDTPVSFQAAGRVNGTILNQFSLGEYENVLRLATTTGNTFDRTSKNHVYCLKQNADKLDLIGSITDIAPGERLYSARFMGPRGFLVTFVQVDPLFTLDLSNPNRPLIKGQLKVPGYSTYLHPIDNNYLLSVGQETTLEGDVVRVKGLQLSMFDISDFSTPRLLYSRTIGDRGTYSEALYNHKALTFWPEKKLLALPVNLFEVTGSSAYGANTFNGLYVYRLTSAFDFSFLGRVDMYDPEDIDFDRYMPSWYRGVFIGDYVYAATASRVRSAPVDRIREPFITLNLTGPNP